MIIKTYWESQAWVRMAPDLVLEQLQSPGCAHTSPVWFQTQQCWSEGNRRSTHLLKKTTIMHHKSISVAYKWPKPQLCSGLGGLRGAVCSAKGLQSKKSPSWRIYVALMHQAALFFSSYKIQLTSHIYILTFHTGKHWLMIPFERKEAVHTFINFSSILKMTQQFLQEQPILSKILSTSVQMLALG